MTSVQRLNRRPIFIVTFTRGGSNILLNLLRSHPDVVGVRGELQQAFRGMPEEPAATRLAKRLRYAPVLLCERRHVMSVSDWTDRPRLHPLSARTLDRVLWGERFRARHASENRYVSEGVAYRRHEIAAARMVVKNVDGLIFLSERLAETFPDACFVGLIRNGYAVCEGRHRRGEPLERIARRYAAGVERLERDAARLPRFRVFRYEDLIDPASGTLDRILEHCELDPARLTRVRLETKRVIDGAGVHRDVAVRPSATGGTADSEAAGTPASEDPSANGKRLVWYEREDCFAHFVQSANSNQIARLSTADLALIEHHAGAALARHGYGPTGR